MITNGRREVHARTLTSVCKDRIGSVMMMRIYTNPLIETDTDIGRVRVLAASSDPGMCGL